MPGLPDHLPQVGQARRLRHPRTGIADYHVRVKRSIEVEHPDGPVELFDVELEKPNPDHDPAADPPTEPLLIWTVRKTAEGLDQLLGSMARSGFTHQADTPIP